MQVHTVIELHSSQSVSQFKDDIIESTLTLVWHRSRESSVLHQEFKLRLIRIFYQFGYCSFSH